MEFRRKLEKKTNLEDLAYNKEGREHIRILQEASINAELQECSFRPAMIVSKRYEKIEPLYKEKENIMDNIKFLQKKKEIEIDQQKKIAEYKEYKECTFKPEIKTKALPEQHFQERLTKSVAGMEKFLQMRDRKKKLEEEKKEREEKVFHLEKRYNQNKHESYTTAKPFSLSKGVDRSIRDAKLRQELETQQSQNTFKPQTNEGKNREIIRRLISNEN